MSLLRTTALGAIAASAIGLSATHDAHACTTANMTNFGGNIAAIQHVYAVYWGWNKYGGINAVRNVVSGVLGDSLDPTFGMGGSKWINTEIQYGNDNDYALQFGPFTPINVPGILAGSYSDEHNLPAAGSAITDSIIQTEVDYLVSNGIISLSKDTVVMMLLPPGFASPIAGACGQHFVSPGGNLLAWIPYPDAVSGCGISVMQQAMVHELVESVVDPLWNIGKFGWTQTNASCEIGDLCEFTSFNVQIQPQYNLSGLYSQVQTQPYWSNEYGGCVYSRATNAFVFGIGMDHKLWAELAQSDSKATLYGWNSWGSPGGNTANFTYGPGAASWGPGRLDVFAVESGTGKIDHAYSENSGSSYTWESLPVLPSGSVASSPDAVSWGAGNVQVWVKGETFFTKQYAPTTVWSNTYDWGHGWSGWTDWGSQLPSGVQPASKITVASPMATNTNAAGAPQSVNTVYAAFIDKTSVLRLATVQGGTMTFTAGVTPAWNGSPIALAGDPDLASWAPGRLDLLVRDTGGVLYDCISGDMASILGVTSGNATCIPLPSPAGGFGVGAGVAGMGDGRLLIVGRGASGGGAFEEFITPSGSTGWLGGSGNGQFLSALDVTAL